MNEPDDVWAMCLLACVKPFDEWRAEVQPSEREVKLYCYVRMELLAIALAGVADEDMKRGRTIH